MLSHQHYEKPLISLIPYIIHHFTSKEITFPPSIHHLILSGINEIADTIQTSIGPKGRNVLIDSQYSEPKLLKTGISIAKSISFSNHYKNMGARILKQVTEKVSSTSGDCTSTACIITRYIIKESLKCISSGVNPTKIRIGMKLALTEIDKYLTNNSIPILSKEDIEKFATISSNSNEVGKLVGGIISKIGVDGIVNFHNGTSLQNEVSLSNGIIFNRGYISNHFINNNTMQRCEFDNPLILLCLGKIKDIKQMTNALEYSLKVNRPLLVIAEDYESEIIGMMVINKVKNNIKICAVKAPAFGDNRKNTLEDFAIATGGVVLDNKIQNSYINPNIFGSSKRVIVTKEETTIIEPKMNNTPILNQRMNDIRNLMYNEPNEYEKEKYQTRLNRLSGGIATVRIGGASETEIEEMKEKIEHSVNATKMAMKEGVIAGGGAALVNASKEIEKMKVDNSEEIIGVNIVKEALKEPIKAICKNAGVNGESIVERILMEREKNVGFDVNERKICDMVKKGIVDSVKAMRMAVGTAVNIAGMTIMSEVGIIEDANEIGKKKKKKINEDIDD